MFKLVMALGRFEFHHLFYYYYFFEFHHLNWYRKLRLVGLYFLGRPETLALKIILEFKNI